MAKRRIVIGQGEWFVDPHEHCPEYECIGCGATWDSPKRQPLKNEYHYPQCPIHRSPSLLANARRATLEAERNK